jgi:hypothetical protein
MTTFKDIISSLTSLITRLLTGNFISEILIVTLLTPYSKLKKLKKTYTEILQAISLRKHFSCSKQNQNAVCQVYWKSYFMNAITAANNRQ